MYICSSTRKKGINLVRILSGEVCKWENSNCGTQLATLPGRRAETLKSSQVDRAIERTLPSNNQPHAPALYRLKLSGLS